MTNSDSAKQRTRRAAPYAAMSGVVRLTLALVGLFLLVRYLPPEQYGVWAILTGLASPITLFTSFGFQQSILRFMPGRVDQEERRRLLWGTVSRRLLLAALAALALAAAYPLVRVRFGLEGSEGAFLAILPGLVATCGSIYTVAGLNVSFRQREILVATLLQQALFVALVVSGIVMGRDLFYFACIFSLSSVLLFLLTAAACAQAVGRPRLQDLIRGVREAPEERRYRWVSYVDDVGSNFLSADLSRYLIAAFSPTTEVAIFAVAANVVTKLQGLLPVEIFRPLATVSFFARLEESEDQEQVVNRMFHFLFNANRLVGVLYVALFLSLGREALVWAFREEYADAYLPALFFFVGIGLFSAPLGLVAQALQRPEVLIYSKAAVLVNLGLGIPLTIHYGASGMALATLLSTVTRNSLCFFLLRRGFPLRVPVRSTVRFMLAGGLVSLVTWALKGSLPLPVVGVVGVACYLIAVRALRVLSEEERRLLVSLLPDRAQGIAKLIAGR